MSSERLTHTGFNKFFSAIHSTLTDHSSHPYLLWMVLGIVMLAMTVESLVDIRTDPSSAGLSWLVIGIIDGSGLLLYFLSRKGYVRLASYTLVAVLWLLTTWLDWTQGGVYAPTLDIAYLVIIVIAGLLLGERAGIVMGGVCALSMLILALNSPQTGVPSLLNSKKPLEIFWDDLVYVGIVVGLQSLATSTIKRALVQARQELTERQRAEASLSAAKAYAENLIQAANTLVIGLNRQGQVTIFNSAAQKTTGYTHAELPDRSRLELALPPGLYPDFWDQLAQVPERRHPRIFESPLLTKTGEERLIVWQMTPIEDEIVAFGIDVTERKRLEEDRQRNQTQLEVQRLLADQREAERLKIARDLHDGPVQDLIGAIYALSGLIDDTTDPHLQAGLQEIQAGLQKEVDSLRIYAGELRPPTLMKFGLAKAIRDHMELLQEKHPEIALDLDACSDGETLPEGMRLVLFRVYQEAMNNILRHAQASRVRIGFEIDGDQVSLSIHDDGVGFTLPPDWTDLARQRHLGLVGMRERVEAAGGQLKINSQPGQGTNVCVTFCMKDPPGSTGNRELTL